MNSWKLLSPIASDTLRQARNQTHAAVQLVAMIGRSYLPENEEDMFANMGWSEGRCQLIGQDIGEGLHVGIAPRDLQITFFKGDTPQSQFCLDGMNWEEAVEATRNGIANEGCDSKLLKADWPYEIEAYKLFDTGTFCLEPREGFQVLDNAYENASEALEAYIAGKSEASPVRLWPHHFDIASLMDLGGGKSIGLGFSPGDDTGGGYHEPYYYVNVWPHEGVDKTKLQPLNQGHWHTEGWLGGVLTWQDLIAETSADGQKNKVKAFFEETIAKGRKLLG